MIQLNNFTVVLRDTAIWRTETTQTCSAAGVWWIAVCDFLDRPSVLLLLPSQSSWERKWSHWEYGWVGLASFIWECVSATVVVRARCGEKKESIWKMWWIWECKVSGCWSMTCIYLRGQTGSFGALWLLPIFIAFASLCCLQLVSRLLSHSGHCWIRALWSHEPDLLQRSTGSHSLLRSDAFVL